MKYRIILLSVIIIFCNNITAQKTFKHTDISEVYKSAMNLYDNQMYGAAQKMFEKIMMMNEDNTHTSFIDDATFYYAMCAMYLTNDNAEFLITEFIEENPESYNNQAAIFKMANYNFQNKKYRDALSWYEKVDRLALEAEKLPEYHFKMGFSHFARRDYDRAAKAFYESRNDKGVYGPMSLYFYSHIKYLNRHYQTALLGFMDLKDHPVFSGIVPFYIIQIYYLQTRYEEIIDYSKELLETIEGPRTAELSKLIGSSHFKIGQYDKAIPYLKSYRENVRQITDHDNYELGYSFYMTNQYSEAIKYFSRIASMRDTLSQNVAYHLADCYLKLDKKKDAKLAFETAASYDFNPIIKEDALFNFAILSFELDINPFNEAIRALTKYIEEYPNSLRVDDAYNYLIDAFWSTKNYKDAVATIESMDNRTPILNEAYQRLAYYRGLEVFTTLDYNKAIKYFDKSLEYRQYNANIEALCYYWKADAHYRMNNLDNAIKLYKEFNNKRGALTVVEYNHSHYNLGYAYFHKQDYRNALSWFRKFESLEREPSIMHNDALNRIGDCYYIQRNFGPAAEYYKKSAIMGKIQNDYALYQMALAYGGQRQPQQKIWSLSRLIREHPNSEYAGNASYEIGRTYNAELNNPDSAKYYFNKLLTDYPNSSMRRSALASLGSIYFNERQYENALEQFKLVVGQFPNTNEASNAIEMIRAIYVEMNKTDEYFEYASTELEGYEISPDEQDSLSFAAAKNLYIEKKFYPALDAFTNFLKRFPNSRNAVEAHYYKAELHYHFDEKDEAMHSYIKVADAPMGKYSEASTIRAASLLFDKKDFEKSLKYYSQLYRIAENRNNKLIAAIGRLRTAYQTETYDEVVQAAVDVIESDRSNEEQKREAYYKMAKARLAKGQQIRALSLFERLATEVTSYEGAEAKYRTAQINFEMGNDSIAEEIIYDFAKMNSPQQYWIGKGFILLSDIFYKKGDLFSAKHTLQSLLNNYMNETDGLKDLASDKLTEIIEKEEEEKSMDDFLNHDFEINENIPEEQQRKRQKEDEIIIYE